MEYYRWQLVLCINAISRDLPFWCRERIKCISPEATTTNIYTFQSYTFEKHKTFFSLVTRLYGILWYILCPSLLYWYLLYKSDNPLLHLTCIQLFTYILITYTIFHLSTCTYSNITNNSHTTSSVFAVIIVFQHLGNITNTW